MKQFRTNFKILVYATLCVVILGFRSSALALPEDVYEARNQSIDFRIFYPYIGTKGDYRRARLNYAGIDFTYDLQIYRSLIFSFIPAQVWFYPLKLGVSKSTFYSIGSLAGVKIRPFADSYLDPQIGFYGGVARQAPGTFGSAKFAYPMSSQLSFSLFKESGRFQDNTLALRASATTSYYIGQPKALSPWYMDFGLSLYGSF